MGERLRKTGANHPARPSSMARRSRREGVAVYQGDWEYELMERWLVESRQSGFRAGIAIGAVIGLLVSSSLLVLLELVK